jgi:predicted metal-dependent TIM-barrel fold hydrolase
MLEMYGTDRTLINSSADWGPSDPSTLQESVQQLKRRGRSEADALEVFYNNPCRFLGQNPKFKHKPIRIVEE